MLRLCRRRTSRLFRWRKLVPLMCFVIPIFWRRLIFRVKRFLTRLVWSFRLIARLFRWRALLIPLFPYRTRRMKRLLSRLVVLVRRITLLVLWLVLIVFARKLRLRIRLLVARRLLIRFLFIFRLRRWSGRRMLFLVVWLACRKYRTWNRRLPRLMLMILTLLLVSRILFVVLTRWLMIKPPCRVVTRRSVRQKAIEHTTSTYDTCSFSLVGEL